MQSCVIRASSDAIVIKVSLIFYKNMLTADGVQLSMSGDIYMLRLFAIIGLFGLLFTVPAAALDAGDGALSADTQAVADFDDLGTQLAATTFKSSRVSTYGQSNKGPRRVVKVPMGARSGNIVAKVYLARQEMEVYINGTLRHKWKISSGKAGFSTPRGTYRPQRIYSSYFSRKYDNAPMPSAVFFRGGYAVHGTGHVSALGRRASHGCIRLHPGNARQFFNLAKTYGQNVKIQII